MHVHGSKRKGSLSPFVRPPPPTHTFPLLSSVEVPHRPQREQQRQRKNQAPLSEEKIPKRGGGGAQSLDRRHDTSMSGLNEERARFRAFLSFLDSLRRIRFSSSYLSRATTKGVWLGLLFSFFARNVVENQWREEERRKEMSRHLIQTAYPPSSLLFDFT